MRRREGARHTNPDEEPKDRAAEQDPDGPSDVRCLEHPPEECQDGEFREGERERVEKFGNIEKEFASERRFLDRQVRDVFQLLAEAVINPWSSKSVIVIEAVKEVSGWCTFQHHNIPPNGK